MVSQKITKLTKLMIYVRHCARCAEPRRLTTTSSLHYCRMDAEIGTLCMSTEEMLHDIDALNKRTDIKHLVIYSTDVENMYPRLDVTKVAEVVAEEYLKSDLNIEVDPTELSLYLAIMVEKDELHKVGLSDVVHTRISIGGRKIGITTEEIIDRGKKTKSLFYGPARVPTRDETRLMLSMALTILIKTAMQNHIYSFSRKIRRQTSGGGIGNKLTGALATVWMLYWARIFKNKIKSATEDIPDFEIVDEFIESDQALPKDVRTADIILQIANSYF